MGFNECVGLNENGPEELIHLNTWSTVSGTLLEGLGGVSLLRRCAFVGGGEPDGVGFEV